jgi:hypothetical protein
MNKYFIIAVVVVAVLYLYTRPASLTGESTAGSSGTCSISGTQMTCSVSNRGFNPGNGGTSTSITIPSASAYASTQGLNYNECRVQSVNVNIFGGQPAGCSPTASDLNTQYDTTGDSCPVHFSNWCGDANLGSQATFSATVVFYKSTTTTVQPQTPTPKTPTTTTPVVTQPTNILQAIYDWIMSTINKLLGRS